LLGVATRDRCRAYGNLTRCDVVSTKRPHANQHFTLGGEMVIDAKENLTLSVDSVGRRGRGRMNAIESFEDETDRADERASQPS
jgi:hypothetical protein